MTNQEARFILGAFRPDGCDAGDAMFATALTQAENDPELRAWFEAQRRLDATLAAKVQQITPPPELRETILAGARITAAVSARRWWKNPLWLVAAAAIVVGVTLSVPSHASRDLPTGSDLAAFALDDLVSSQDENLVQPPELIGVQARLAAAEPPLSANLKLDLTELERQSCRPVWFEGHELFEICFQRGGTRYHIYVGHRSEFTSGAIEPAASMKERGQFAAVAWADADHVYALVTREGAEALRRVI